MIATEKIETDFAKLLETGWPAAVVRAKPERDGPGILGLTFALLAGQLVNSEVPETRTFWRAKLGLPNEVVP